jgi:RNA polymerase sigma factor (sigma-70 family)
MSLLNEMVEKNYPELLKIGIHLTKSESKAYDLISETYLDLAKKPEKEIPCVNQRFKWFFYKCMLNVKNQQYSEYTKLINPKYEYRQEWNDEPDEIADESDFQNKIQKIGLYKERLPELYKTLFELLYEEELSYRKIARVYQDLTGVPIGLKSIFILANKLKTKIKNEWNLSTL